jgi:hypothetical protein
LSLPLVAPVFLICAQGREFAARGQRHNEAWNEARFLSWEHGPVELVRVSDGGGSAVVGSFEHGRPVPRAVGVAS